MLDVVRALPVRHLTMGLETLAGAQRMSNAYGLLASDALILALMEEYGITDLATNDDDFDRVPSLRVWKPR
jgi:predicted nucleic acid-binding protein